ncbi:signal peptide peptidase SppA [Pontibacter sp. BT310]|uniref:Signal peptide peptidase SppA n=1 Tax=Pontibacter populi TaxID=890055 RepID=A0ABS6XCQ7_9BACT|nr:MULTISPECIES: signal peptide peptidase SppA [Pontibacter]MBJ6118833.1 signal peptide peptidase SppA [Pontibacter sp. BT310]MBR0571261.1 signal peptide peptidase SppA [Microvirga sp. STS03]MBW3365687.1 signal peptide peptidase SppA [Pontibacter populi]
MLQFLKYVLATIVGLLLFSLISFLIMVGIIASAASKDEVSIVENSVLELKLDKPIAERDPQDPWQELGFAFGGFSSTDGLDQIKASIRKAKTDDNIKGIFLNMRFVDGGMAKLEEIRNELIDFKKSGKFIVSYTDLSQEKAYYLASVADKIYVNPLGTIEFNGMSSEVYFFKGTLDKLDIKPQIFKVGEFKSAVEPFFLDKMSEPARLQMQSFLNSINDYQLRNIAKSRNKSYEELKNISDNLLVRDAEDAKKYGLITDVGYYDEAIAYLKEKSGVKEDGKLELVQLSKYKKAEGKKESNSSKNRIAVIYAEGDIVDGKGDDDEIGSERFAEAIRKARMDDKVKAVVLRISSPGGSALASDVMWREIQLTKKVKPVIASMSDVAASGGYYLAMGCDTIVAHPNTITGSIGVFGIIPNIQGFMNNKLGITIDNVKTGKYSDVPTLTRPMTEFEQEVVQRQINQIYDVFTKKAAQGRGMSQDKLKEYASGRVWSGAEAKERNLVDVFGGLETAIEIAAAKANIKDDYRITELPARKSFVEELMGDAGKQVKEAQVKAELGELYPLYNMYKKVEHIQGMQTRMPYNLSVE